MMQQIVAALKTRPVQLMAAVGSGFGLYMIFHTTARGKPYLFREDLTGKTYLVTGATTGIGRSVVESLAMKGARVIMICRDREKCRIARSEIVKSASNPKIYCRACDMSDFDSIYRFADKLLHGKPDLGRIDGLVNNAGIMTKNRRTNTKNIELDLSVNHLGHFLLTALLLDKMLAQPHPVRIVFVSTDIALKETVNFDDFNMDKSEFDAQVAYEKSKAAQLLFAKELSERLKDTNIKVIVACPPLAKTNLQTEVNSQMLFIGRWLFGLIGLVTGRTNAEAAARPVIFATADSELEGVNGQIFGHIGFSKERIAIPWPEYYLDTKVRKRLWATSEKWTNLADYYQRLNATSAVDNQQQSVSSPQLTSWLSLSAWKFW